MGKLCGGDLGREKEIAIQVVSASRGFLTYFLEPWTAS